MLNYPRGMIHVSSVYPMQTSLVDSMFGIPLVYSAYDGVEITWRNTSGKTINYVTFTLVALNKVGDYVPTVGSTPSAILKLVGPVENGKTLTSKSNGFWQHGLVNFVGIIQIVFEFSDGTTTTYQMQHSHGSFNNFYKDLQIGDQVKTIKLGSTANSPCYVATCVYGSYDCPEVWTLRRFRDYELAETWYGRAFIKTYYAISPTIVKWFGKTKWFNSIWKPVLDKMVISLQAKGFSSDPYQDRDW